MIGEYVENLLEEAEGGAQFGKHMFENLRILDVGVEVGVNQFYCQNMFGVTTEQRLNIFEPIGKILPLFSHQLPHNLPHLQQQFLLNPQFILKIVGGFLFVEISWEIGLYNSVVFDTATQKRIELLREIAQRWFGVDVVAEEAPKIVAGRWAVLLAYELAQPFSVGVVEVVEECGQVVEGSFVGLLYEGDLHAVVEAHQQSCEKHGVFVDWLFGDIFEDLFDWILE